MCSTSIASESFESCEHSSNSEEVDDPVEIKSSCREFDLEMNLLLSHLSRFILNDPSDGVIELCPAAAIASVEEHPVFNYVQVLILLFSTINAMKMWV
jgi:hypothetical protein